MPSRSKQKPTTSTSTTEIDHHRDVEIQPRKSLAAFLEVHPVEHVPINYSSLALIYYYISQEEMAETQNGIQIEIDLDNSLHETQELLVELEVRVELN